MGVISAVFSHLVVAARGGGGVRRERGGTDRW
jgi:hypothetical protein